MLRHAAAVIKATNEVKGLWRADKALPIAKPNELIIEITEAQHLDISIKETHYRRGPARFKWDGTGIVEVPDTRTRLRFIPAIVDIDVRTPPVTVTAEVLLPDGSLDTGFNDPRKILTFSQKRLKLNFNSGVATFIVRSNRELNLALDALPEFVLEAPLLIRIVDDEIG